MPLCSRSMQMQEQAAASPAIKAVISGHTLP